MIKLENDRIIITMEVDGEEKVFTIVVNHQSIFIAFPPASNVVHAFDGMVSLFSLGTNSELLMEELAAFENEMIEQYEREQEQEHSDDQSLNDMLGDIKI